MSIIIDITNTTHPFHNQVMIQLFPSIDIKHKNMHDNVRIIIKLEPDYTLSIKRIRYKKETIPLPTNMPTHIPNFFTLHAALNQIFTHIHGPVDQESYGESLIYFQIDGNNIAHIYYRPGTNAEHCLTLKHSKNYHDQHWKPLDKIPPTMDAHTHIADYVQQLQQAYTQEIQKIQSTPNIKRYNILLIQSIEQPTYNIPHIRLRVAFGQHMYRPNKKNNIRIALRYQEENEERFIREYSVFFTYTNNSQIYRQIHRLLQRAYANIQKIGPTNNISRHQFITILRQIKGLQKHHHRDMIHAIQQQYNTYLEEYHQENNPKKTNQITHLQ